jgi:alpha-amylase
MTDMKITQCVALLAGFVSLSACEAPQPSPIRPDDDKANDGSNTGALTAADLWRDDLPRSAVVQLFNWPFAAIEAEMCDLADQGFSHVHVSPPQVSNGGPWWGRYQPLDYRKIAGPLGDEAAFASMLAEADRCDVVIVADVVLNHMANLGLNSGELYYPQGCDRSLPLASSSNACLFAPQNFHNEECISNYDNLCAVLYGRICGGSPDRGLPDLATGNCGGRPTLDPNERNFDPHVAAMAKDYLARLVDLGVRAFRFDAAKHMHPAFLAEVLSDPRLANTWSYGEIITSRADDQSLSFYRNLPLDFMDFPFASTLKNAFSFGGDLRSISNAINEQRGLPGYASVAFVTNHDVWGNDGGLGYRYGSSNEWRNRNVNGEHFRDEMLAHMVILGRNDGIPYVYSEYTDGPSQDYRDDAYSYVNFHRRPAISALMRFHSATLSFPQTWRWEDAEHLVWSRGELALMAVNKSGAAWPLDSVVSGLADGVYVDLLTQQRVSARGGRVTALVPPRGGLVLMRALDG